MAISYLAAGSPLFSWSKDTQSWIVKEMNVQYTNELILWTLRLHAMAENNHVPVIPLPTGISSQLKEQVTNH
jgi:hypothetical protein